MQIDVCMNTLIQGSMSFNKLVKLGSKFVCAACVCVALNPLQILPSVQVVASYHYCYRMRNSEPTYERWKWQRAQIILMNGGRCRYFKKVSWYISQIIY